jgi:NADH-quinone oxidoreductase subunit D
MAARMIPTAKAARVKTLESKGGKKLLELNMGPQHPSTHGVLRLKVKLDGEVVEDVEPVLGYLHRSKEKIAELHQYLKFIEITDRMDYNAPGLNEWGFCMAVEKLMDVQVPERGEYLRVVHGELHRIGSHLLFLGTMGLDVGAVTPFFWSWREREQVLNLNEALTGVRMHSNYVRFGGVKFDIPEGWVPKVREFLGQLPARLDEFEDLLVQNDIVRMRMINIGVLSKQDAVALGATGPMARASGVGYDMRKYDPYSVYDRFDFDVAVADTGDVYARFLVRIMEVRESIKIIEQALDDLPEGDILDPSVEGAKQFRIKPAKGEAYGRIESAKGELAYYIVSDGSMKPYRVKIRGPSYTNLQCLRTIARGQKIPDLIASLGSIDIVLGDVDR